MVQSGRAGGIIQQGGGGGNTVGCGNTARAGLIIT